MMGREGERERNINAWLPPTHPLLGTWPATQACALTGNRIDNLLFRRLALNPLSHTSQGKGLPFELKPRPGGGPLQVYSMGSLG